MKNPLRLRFRCPLPPLPVKDGQRYCELCEKNVTDLSCLQPAEAAAWIRAHPGACVQIRSLQHLGLGLVAAGVLAASPVMAYDEDSAGEPIQDDSEPSYRISIQLEGWNDPHAVRDILYRQTPLIRSILEPLIMIDPVSAIVLTVDCQGHITSVSLNTKGAPVPKTDHWLKQLKHTQLPPSDEGGTITLHLPLE